MSPYASEQVHPQAPRLAALPLLFLLLVLPVARAAQYPVGVTNCGVSSWINATPSRAVTMNQGATEMMLALNLSGRMVGTAYLDDEIWPEVTDAYTSIPVLSDEYPAIDQLLAVRPDFVYASYASAFQLDYVNYTAHVGECVLKIPDADDESSDNSTFCRKELNDKGIQTYLQVAQCEKAEHRPDDNTVAVLFEEIWEIATVFDAFDEARELVDSIDSYFDKAIEVSSRGGNDPVTVLWLDSWDDASPFVGACCGSVQTIIHHSGAKNIFDDVGLEAKSTWASVTWDEIEALDPDVVVLVDASWDKAGM
jgi:iron complex transport system substrate-binding protein